MTTTLDPPTWTMDDLTPKQQMFVHEYLIDLNGAAAARRAGYSAKTAEVQGARLLSNVKVRMVIDAMRGERTQRVIGEADDVLKRLWSQFEADPRKLAQVVIDCCRFCYGEGHKYQFTQGEWDDKLAQVEDFNAKLRMMGEDAEKFLSPPDPRGGLGYDPHKPPLRHCPDCHGRGIPSVELGDMRRLGPAEARLMAGVKQGQYGIEVKITDQSAVTALLARHFGLDKNTVVHEAGAGFAEKLEAGRQRALALKRGGLPE